MQLPYSWLRELTGTRLDAHAAARLLTRNGVAVEKIEAVDQFMQRVIIARVEEVHSIEGAKVRRTVVNTGREHLQVVCGAPNVAAGQLVAFAPIGASVAGGNAANGTLTISQAKIRGVDSFGMICSERELGLSDSHSGILVLTGAYEPGAPFAESLGYNDHILHFEITPNRGDCLSVIGIARELAAAEGLDAPVLQSLLQSSAHSPIQGTPSGTATIAIADPADCPRFTVRMIEGIANGESPMWLQQRLRRLGLRPISLAVDITNYVMHEFGNPMHAFDADRYQGSAFHVRRATAGEKITTLDGKARDLTGDVLVVADARHPVGLAGVMGGSETEVHDGTTRILLEVAAFSPSVVRKGRKVVDLSTDASYRFERAIDIDGIVRASNRAAQLFVELAGAKIVGPIIDQYPDKSARSTLTFRIDRANAVLGSSLDSAAMQQRLTRLGFSSEPDGKNLKVTAPTFRNDIEREIDLIEEVARLDGYDCIPEATRTKGPLFTPVLPTDLLERTLRRALTAAGFDEMMGSGLADSKNASAFSDSAKVRILNPVADDLDIMRDSLLVTAMEVLAHNLAQRNLTLRLFELGRIYLPVDGGEPREPLTLSLAVGGNEQAHWRAAGGNKERPLDFYDLTVGIQAFADSIHLPALTYSASALPWAEPGTGFELLSGNRRFGVAGKVRVKVAGIFDIKLPVHLAQIDLTGLDTALTERPVYHPIPQFPASPRDLALILNEQIRVGELIDCIKAIAGSIAEEIECFDLYRGKPIPAGKKSVAIRITYRKSDASLTGGEVDAVQSEVTRALMQRFDAEVRDH